MTRNSKSLFHQTNSLFSGILGGQEDNAIELNVRDDASDAIDESIIPTLYNNPRAPPFNVQDIRNFSAFKNMLIQLTSQNV